MTATTPDGDGEGRASTGEDVGAERTHGTAAAEASADEMLATGDTLAIDEMLATGETLAAPTKPDRNAEDQPLGPGVATEKTLAPSDIDFASGATAAASGSGAPVRPPATRDNEASLPSSLARGQTLGRYVVLNLLGRGGMGEVYAAYDPELDRKVALKVIRPGAATQRRRRRRARACSARRRRWPSSRTPTSFPCSTSAR